MARGTWTIQTKSGGVWSTTATIYRPNDNMSIIKASTQTKVSLADGSDGYITPSTKYRDDPIRLIWYYDDGTLKTQIEGYVTNQTDLKIIDHDSNEYVGRFVSVDVLQMVGQDPDVYDVQAVFERMPSLA